MPRITQDLIRTSVDSIETQLNAWNKPSQSLAIRVGGRVAMVLAVEALTIAALVYHGICLSTKSTLLASRALLCSLPIAKVQTLGSQLAKGLSWEGLQREHLQPAGQAAAHEALRHSFSPLVQPSVPFAALRKTLNCEGVGIASRCWNFIKQPKVLATLAVGTSLAALWYFNQPLKREFSILSSYGGKDEAWRISQLPGNRFYADRWNLKHEIYDTKLENLVKPDGVIMDDLSPWNLISILQDKLNGGKAASGTEQWYMMATDNTMFTTQDIGPAEALDLIREKDSSLILTTCAKGVASPLSCINTDFFIARHDSESQTFINSVYDRTMSDISVEQAVRDELTQSPTWLEKVVELVVPRETSEGSARHKFAFNTVLSQSCHLLPPDDCETFYGSTIPFLKEGCKVPLDQIPTPAWQFKLGDWVAQVCIDGRENPNQVTRYLFGALAMLRSDA